MPVVVVITGPVRKVGWGVTPSLVLGDQLLPLTVGGRLPARIPVIKKVQSPALSRVICAGWLLIN